MQGMHQLRVAYRPEASADFREILQFIRRGGASHSVARAFLRRIKARCERIGDAPFLGRSRDDLEPGMRTLPFERSVVIAYRIETDRVLVTNVFYSGRDFEALYRGALPPDEP